MKKSTSDPKVEENVSKVPIGVITAPVEAAQESADLLVMSGVKAILNFSPARVAVPANVRLKNVDFTSGQNAIPYYMNGLHTTN